MKTKRQAYGMQRAELTTELITVVIFKYNRRNYFILYSYLLELTRGK